MTETGLPSRSQSCEPSLALLLTLLTSSLTVLTGCAPEKGDFRLGDDVMVGGAEADSEGAFSPWPNDVWSISEPSPQGADRSYADYENQDLRETSFSYDTLTGANFENAHLTGASFVQSWMPAVNLRGATAFGVNFSGANLTGADLTDANLSGSNLQGTNLTGATLLGTNLFGTQLDGVILDDADLTDANLSSTQAHGISARRAIFFRAVPFGSSITDSDLRDVILAHAKLSSSDLTGSNLDGADLGGVVWAGVICPDGTPVAKSPQGNCCEHIDLLETTTTERAMICH